jgi:hypothetical protein
MADFAGTSGDDVLDQTQLGLADWSGTIKGLAGNDKLSGGSIHLQGGPGNDVLTGRNSNTTVNYYDTPSGVSVNLLSGSALDGWGGIDTLVNIHIVHGSRFADTFIGSQSADNFWVGVGDVVQANAGTDTITVWEPSAGWQVRKISHQKAQLVQLSTGKIIDLFDAEYVQFQDKTLSLLYEEKTVYQDTKPSIPQGSFMFVYGKDINRDGLWDLVICAGVAPPSAAVETPAQVLIQRQDGTFQKAQIAGSVEGFVHPREVGTGDFNGDGLTDVVVVGHGYDTSPFPGETPTIYWGQVDGSFIDGSEALPQTPAFTHSVAVADINGDNIDDLFLGNIYGKEEFTPRLLLGQNNGRFIEANLPNSIGSGALQPNGNRPVTSLLADVTGDGIIDLIGGGDYSVSIYPGLASAKNSQAGPFFAEKTNLPNGFFGVSNSHTVDVQTLDLNHDGRQDLVLSQTTIGYQGGRAIQLLLQTSTGQWVDETESRMKGWDARGDWIAFVNLVDLNQDGHTDLLATGTSKLFDCAFINDGTGHFFPAGPSTGVPSIKGEYLLPAQAGKVFSVTKDNSGLLSVQSIDIPAGLTGPQSTLPALKGAPGFNEQYYLRMHPDVAASLSAGQLTSGLSAYLSSGVAAGHRGFAPGTTVWGHEGIDTVPYNGLLSSYSVTRQSLDVWRLTGGSTGQASDVLKGIERIQFSDTTLALDLSSHAGSVAKTLGAVFGKEAVANKSFVGIGLHFLDELNFSYPSLMELAINARLGANASSAQVVDLLYNNVVGQAPDAATRKTFTDLLDNGTFTVGGLGVLAADTELNQTNINLMGLVQTGLEYLPLGR